jgi:integrase
MPLQAPLPEKGDRVEWVEHPKYFLHENVSFDEDRWDLNYRSNVARPCDGRVSFADFAFPVKNYIKEFIANGILVVGLSNGWVHKSMAALRKAFRFLVERHGADFSPLRLTRYDAFALEEYFCQNGIAAARAQLAIIARFAAFLRDQYDGSPADFRPNALVAPNVDNKKRSFTEGLEQVIPDEVSYALMEAVGRHRLFLDEKFKKSKAKYLQSHNLYLAVLVLLFFSGRRISEVLLLRRECLRELSLDEHAEIKEEGVWLVFYNTKVGLGQQEIFIAEPAAALVRTMVERVRALTDSLAEIADRDGLFLTDSPYAGIRGTSANAFDIWLNGQTTEGEDVVRPGFIHRYNIKFQGKYYHINPHQMRHTLSYKAYMGGASYVDVGDHLQHRRTITGLSPMTGVYIHGQEKDVQRIRAMHEKRLISGKSVPLIDNRLVVLKDLNPCDVTLWREQGMILHTTHYGHCILPDISGPCVCGDPCWIGPQGNGCDYALYTPESKKALLDDRTLLVSQIGMLEIGNPRHPRLGQWKARLVRLDQVLKEISEAELRAVNDEIPDRPRDQLIPQDPVFERSSFQPSVERTMRERRRKAARNTDYGPFKRKHDLQPLEEPDASTLALAEVLLRDLEKKEIPMLPSTFAQRLGINVRALYQCTEICDRLSVHNRQHTAPLQEAIEAKLNELRTQETVMGIEEFANLFGISKRRFYVIYPEYPGRLAAQNKMIQMGRAFIEAEKYLQGLIDTRTGQKTREFAKYVQIDINILSKQRPDIIEKLTQHNKAIGMPGMPGIWDGSSKEERIARVHKCWDKAKQEGVTLSLIQLAEQCHFGPETIRRLCPELIVSRADSQEDKEKREEETLSMVFAEIEGSNQAWAIKQFAAVAKVPESAMYMRYLHWTELLSEHNAKVVSAKLQAAWDLLISSEGGWTIVQFAREAGMSYQRLQTHHQDWVKRFQEFKASFSTSECIRMVIEDAKNSFALITPTDVAQRVGITYSTLMRKHSNQYFSLIEHNKVTFGPVVEAAWRKVCASDLYPTVSEFATMCGFRHFSILLAYFPDDAEQVRNRLRLKGQKNGESDSY